MVLRQKRNFYPVYDGVYLALFASLLGLMLWTGWDGLADDYAPWMLWAFPLAAHFVVLCNVFIHNCTHANFPRPINRLVGELCGIMVLTRYASWEIVHRRHHKFSDDEERDPHPVVPSFWRFAWRTLTRVEQQLQRQFFDLHGGDTPENRRHEQLRAVLSFGTTATLVAVWYVFLGFHVFFALFVPLFFVGVLHLLHFNWVTHSPDAAPGEHKPANIDTGVYWLLNRIWFGIYCHANHHRYASLFDPRRLPAHKLLKLGLVEDSASNEEAAA